MKFSSKILHASVAVFFSFSIKAQYILNGSATQNSCNCYTLTQPVNFQSGSVWNSNKINLNNPFDFVFNVYLGCVDANGADGIVFILQPISTSIGSAGGGMGFQGIVPSVGIALDTWQNAESNDPAFDHLSIQVNGDINHANDIVPLVQASPTNQNIEDCQWHTFRITWDPAAKLIKTYFDGNFRIQANIDLIATIFNNDPMVYWGFGAATGGSNNLQQFCTALNPGFNTSGVANATCDGNAITFANTSQSFAPIASYFWDFGDNTTSTLVNPPPHTYAGPGSYQVKLAITGLDGCASDTLRKTITIGDYPVAGFTIYDTCASNAPRITDQSQVLFGNVNDWQWTLDGNPLSVSQYPSLPVLPAGTHNLQLSVKSNLGCASVTAAVHMFAIKPAPVISMITTNGCFNEPVNFSGIQLDNATTITHWNWQLGDGTTSPSQNPSHVFTSLNDSTALTAISDNGCVSNTVKRKIFLNQIKVSANTSDTIAIKNEPFRLRANASFIHSPAGGVTYNWSPSVSLDDAYSPAPAGVLQDDETYIITATTPEGCVAKDTVTVKIFKGSSVFVPTGFTPDNNGLNDLLKPAYYGIKSLDYFKVYSRWGQLVFSTKNMSAGWDAMINGIKQPTGVYIWTLKAIDYTGKVYQLKGTSTVIR
jgi:gliding motility-associated-like protein